MTVLSELAVVVGGDVVCVEALSDEITLKQYIQYKCGSAQREDIEDPFFVVDLGRLINVHSKWKASLPGIWPFYAVKCNDDILLLKTLASLGTGFDCASKAEIKMILDLGVSPDRIIYANPCKQTSHLRYAAKKGVDLMTFDDELELHKIKKHFPAARLVLRIRADCPDAILPLGVKYGCTIPVAKRLLHIAASMELSIIGVSFHVGSDCTNPSSYLHALKLASEVFHYAAGIGHHLTLLDIGGGYPGMRELGNLFDRMVDYINEGMRLFNDLPGIQVIAEPGRYFACSTHAISVNVISKKHLASSDNASCTFMYYVNDGVYGSFNNVLYEKANPIPTILDDSCSGKRYGASIWGPTCDGIDKICETVIPELDVGDWIYFDDMGAYSVCAFSTFNGFSRPPSYYFIREADRDKFRSLHQLCSSDINIEGKDAVVDSVNCLLPLDTLSQQAPVAVH